jgi:Ca2+-binding EF-hand superfamily protein
MENEAKAKTRTAGMTEMQHVIKVMIDERKSDDQVITIFKALDTDGDGSLGFDEFVKAYQEINPNASMVQLNAMFQEADLDGNGTLDLHEVSF